MGNPKDPKEGDLHIDASGIAVIDYTPEHLNTLTKLRRGYEKAITTLASLTPAQLNAAGIHPDEAAITVALAAEHKQIGVFHGASKKLTELLHETHMDRGHQIATRIAEFVAQAKRRAERSPSGAQILGPLDGMIEYQLGPAEKAVATKAKAAKAAAGKAAKAGKDPAADKNPAADKDPAADKTDADKTP
jgi:hypothetical protein